MKLEVKCKFCLDFLNFVKLANFGFLGIFCPFAQQWNFLANNPSLNWLNELLFLLVQKWKTFPGPRDSGPDFREKCFLSFFLVKHFSKGHQLFPPCVHQKRDILEIRILDFSWGDCLSLLETPPFREKGIFCSLLGLIVSGIKIILEYFSSKFDPFQGLFFKHQSGKISKVADYHRHFFRPRILLKMLFKRTKTLFFKKYFSFNFCKINFFSDFFAK